MTTRTSSWKTPQTIGVIADLLQCDARSGSCQTVAKDFAPLNKLVPPDGSWQNGR